MNVRELKNYIASVDDDTEVLVKATGCGCCTYADYDDADSPDIELVCEERDEGYVEHDGHKHYRDGCTPRNALVLR